MRLVEPVLVDIMQDADAAVIMDSRTVLLQVEVVEITDVAISRIDEQIGSELPEGVSMGRGALVSEGNNDAPDAD
ncbi:hypothetical protein [Roseovarius pacificus]|uniref:hypothetical protein n=1 Tax=Roseovarius pacificus TaxID=337701 RepID=UPI002A18B061|nr:hypothetical protein [Roseovarius pacificus]